MADAQPGEGELKVFNVGERGVVLTKDPLHTVDGEVFLAQNAVSSLEGGLGGLESRPGMSRVNAVAMAGGSVKGFTALPFRDPSGLPLSIYVFLDTNNNPPVYVSFNDGLIWRKNFVDADGTGLGAGADCTDPLVDGVGGPSCIIARTGSKLTGHPPMPMYRKVATIDGRFVYPSNEYFQYPAADHQAPPISAFDGVQPSVLGRVPYSPTAGAGTNAYAITCFGVHEADVYFTSWDTGASGVPAFLGPNVGGRVFKLDILTGVMTQIGLSFGAAAGENAGGVPVCLTSHNGLLWAGTYDQTIGGTGKIWRIRPGVDANWTLDHTTAASKGYIVDLVSFRGELFALTVGEAGTASVVLRRATSGVWAVSDTNTSNAANNGFASPIVYQDALYTWMVGGTATAVSLIRKFDGTAWATDVDLNATFGGAPFTGSIAVVKPGLAAEFNGDLFIVHGDGVLKRHLAVWSRSLNLAGEQPTGDLGWTNVEYT